MAASAAGREAAGRLVAPLAAVVVFLVLCASLGYGLIDDAYISLHYADRLVDGHGLVFNPGERVEGYSNFAWTLLLSLGLALGADGPSVARGLGIASGVGVIAATAWVGSRSLARDPRPLRAAGAPLALAVSAPFVCYAVSGLETPLYALLLLLHLHWLLEGLERPSRLVWAGLALAAAALTRPETPFPFAFAIAALVGLRWRGGRVRAAHVAGFAAAYALPIVAFLLWRHAYYGEWLPNTYHAKVGAFGAELAWTGLAYAARFALRTLALAAIPALLWLALRDRDPRLMLLGGIVCAHLLAVIAEGGDHLALFRFGVPVLPLVALAWQESWTRALPRLGVGIRPAVATALTLATGVGSSLALAHAPGAHGVSEHRRAVLESRLAQQWAAFGRWLASEARADDAVALLPVGAIAYHSGLRSIDMAGLTDRHIARVPARTGTGYIGHEKWDNRYVLGRRPRFVLAHHFVMFPGDIDQAAYDAMTYFPMHRELVGMPEFRSGWRFRTVPAGAGRVFAFYERRETVRPAVRSGGAGYDAVLPSRPADSQAHPVEARALSGT